MSNDLDRYFGIVIIISAIGILFSLFIYAATNNFITLILCIISFIIHIIIYYVVENYMVQKKYKQDMIEYEKDLYKNTMSKAEEIIKENKNA